MTQEDFTHEASIIRAKSVTIAERFGSSQTIISNTLIPFSLCDGWNKVLETHAQENKHAETHFTATGEHYSGDELKGYLEVRGDAGKGFEAATTLKKLRPGRYRVSAVVRASEAEHSNVYIFAKTGNGDVSTKEIPAMGRTGGNVWFSACDFIIERVGD